jgi:hypothetical protein
VFGLDYLGRNTGHSRVKGGPSERRGVTAITPKKVKSLRSQVYTKHTFANSGGGSSEDRGDTPAGPLIAAKTGAAFDRRDSGARGGSE